VISLEEKKEYLKPQLEVIGTVKDLTQGKYPGGEDAYGSMLEV